MKVCSYATLLQYEHAFSDLEHIHTALLQRISPGICLEGQERLLYLPVPEDTATLDSALLNLISLYLLNSIIIFTNLIFSTRTTPNLTVQPTSFIDTLRNQPTLLTWIPPLQLLSSKQIDGMVARVYSIAAKVSTSSLNVHLEVYRFRIYALQCLSFTSREGLTADQYWSRVLKISSVYLSSEKGDQLHVARTISHQIDLVIRFNERSSDFLRGKEFDSLCQYWISIAQKVPSQFITFSFSNC
jgi:hypothetical protein